MNSLRLVVNNATRNLASMFPGFFPGAKHDHYADFGYPDALTFSQLYRMFLRNGIAHAGVDKTVGKSWSDAPFLLDHERDGSDGQDEETTLEKEIRTRFSDLRVWQKLAEVDRRYLVGGYAGAILRFADSKRFSEPVDRVPGGLDGLVEIIPAWAGQLTVSDWDLDEMSETFGQPKMFQFNEANVQTGKQGNRAVTIHPDRVIIWSADGTVNCTSLLEPGYNDLLTLEKISGAGGEGFWKNAKSAPVLEVDKEARIEDMAKAMGVPVSEIADKMNDQVEDWQKGFDKLLMIQGMQAKTLGVTLPSPEHFWAGPLQSFAASIGIPLKILVGSQTGERASTEDSEEWAQTNNARRADVVIPNIMLLVQRLEQVGVLPESDWFVDWTDLTESSMSEKIDRAVKMTTANQNMKDSGELVFTPEEIRATVNYEPLSDDEKYRDEPTDEDVEDALPPNPKDKTNG
jgi:hypothetical protein